MTAASITNTPPPERLKAPTVWVRPVNDFRAPTTARKGDGARRSGNGCPERHTAAGADAAWKYLGDRKVQADGERIPVIGQPGYKQGRGLIERAARAARQVQDSSVKCEAPAAEATPDSCLNLEPCTLETSFWSMRKQLLVSVAIVTGVCIFVGVLGWAGMAALAISLVGLVAAAKANDWLERRPTAPEIYE